MKRPETQRTKAGRLLNRLWQKSVHYGFRNVLKLSNARLRCDTTRIKDFRIDSLSWRQVHRMVSRHGNLRRGTAAEQLKSGPGALGGLRLSLASPRSRYRAPLRVRRPALSRDRRRHSNRLTSGLRTLRVKQARSITAPVETQRASPARYAAILGTTDPYQYVAHDLDTAPFQNYSS